VRLHRSSLHAEDRSVRDNIPVTSVARTLFDLGEVVDRRRLERAFEEADRLRRLDLRAIERVCRRSRGRRSLRVIRPLIDSLLPAPETRSVLERRFVAFCRNHRLPAPMMNALVSDFLVDAVWPSRRLVVELDSYGFHRHRAAFERDRKRDAELQLAGYSVLRLTDRRLTGEPGQVAAQIRRLLGSG
jgi:very-short-patch-repair endonuclease